MSSFTNLVPRNHMLELIAKRAFNGELLFTHVGENIVLCDPKTKTKYNSTSIFGLILRALAAFDIKQKPEHNIYPFYDKPIHLFDEFDLDLLIARSVVIRKSIEKHFGPTIRDAETMIPSRKEKKGHLPKSSNKKSKSQAKIKTNSPKVVKLIKEMEKTAAEKRVQKAVDEIRDMETLCYNVFNDYFSFDSNNGSIMLTNTITGDVYNEDDVFVVVLRELYNEGIGYKADDNIYHFYDKSVYLFHRFNFNNLLEQSQHVLDYVHLQHEAYGTVESKPKIGKLEPVVVKDTIKPKLIRHDLLEDMANRERSITYSTPIAVTAALINRLFNHEYYSASEQNNYTGATITTIKHVRGETKYLELVNCIVELCLFANFGMDTHKTGLSALGINFNCYSNFDNFEDVDINGLAKCVNWLNKVLDNILLKKGNYEPDISNLRLKVIAKMDHNII